jgi:multidrug resistance protein MdtO
MIAPATHRSAPPEVDEGDAPGLAAFFTRELRPTPGRLTDSTRIVAVVLVVVGIAEFRLPDIAISAYIVLFLSRSEAVSTVLSALIMGIVGVVAIVATIAVFMLSLSEPALRIPLMAVATFGAAFLARTATLGPLFFAGGFIIAYGLTFGDELLSLALQPATAGNAAQFELPEFVFVSPEGALVHTLLWLGLAVVMPLGVLIAANLLTGRDPARVLRDALAGRLATAARVCAREKGAELELEAQAFQGTAGLRKLHHLAGLMNQGRRIPVASVSLIDEIRRLSLLLVAWLRPRCAGPRGRLLPRGGTRSAIGRGSARRTRRNCRDRRGTAAGGRDLAHAAYDCGDLGGAALGGGPRKSRRRGGFGATDVGGGCFQQPGVRPLRRQAHDGGDDLLFH